MTAGHPRMQQETPHAQAPPSAPRLRDGADDLPAAANGENDFDGLVTVLKGSALGMTTSGATTYGPIRIGISTGDDHPRLGMIMSG
ncbi:hypothetical protein AB0N62_34495 [Streptomyces sp. NPDC093982]|uniref:hypothetical protein n=1 Tax=Streptomyces sp. NPDC093982 TaxID=3155077 RepID=UPI00342688BB